MTYLENRNPWADRYKIFHAGSVQEVITPASFCEDRLRGFGVARGRILAFSIDLLRRLWNNLALPWECVITTTLKLVRLIWEVRRGKVRDFDAVRCPPLRSDVIIRPIVSYIVVHLCRYTKSEVKCYFPWILTETNDRCTVHLSWKFLKDELQCMIEVVVIIIIIIISIIIIIIINVDL